MVIPCTAMRVLSLPPPPPLRMAHLFNQLVQFLMEFVSCQGEPDF